RRDRCGRGRGGADEEGGGTVRGRHHRSAAAAGGRVGSAEHVNARVVEDGVGHQVRFGNLEFRIAAD
ncbi:hypothetical protein, partial [Saccharothrix sp. ST-888]|uniref:hypothetical protein n=1 Tax=Saccharothrix sp. ST-888 TaxID=1427391 RepID=UPI000AA758B9